MTKVYSNNLLEEMKLLAQFPEESHLEGLKIHNNASETIKTSAQSLFNKGIISQVDGGYLTDSGREMAEQLHNVLGVLEQA